MDQYRPGIYQLERPAEGCAGPVVYNSPHSGCLYPDDFGYACPIDALRRAEDARVDDLFEAAPRHGAALLKALFPRTYIDVNRAPDDIDPGMLEEPWSEHTRLSERAKAGHGLIRKLIRPDYPVYARALTVAEVRHRIETFYIPYHAALKALLDDAHALHGHAWLIDCHSMPSSSALTIANNTPVDIVLGTLDGTSCDLRLVRRLKLFLEQRGYRVSHNDPYKGAEILRRYGNPSQQRNALQIELNRALYLDEKTGSETAHFSTLQRDMSAMIDFITAQVTPLPIER